jgi:hypothetical protein
MNPFLPYDPGLLPTKPAPKSASRGCPWPRSQPRAAPQIWRAAYAWDLIDYVGGVMDSLDGSHGTLPCNR